MSSFRPQLHPPTHSSTRTLHFCFLTDPEDRPFNFMPTKFKALRQVPLYDNLLKERFERCLDLYLCPRTRKKRLLIDPETLIPKLPKPQDLRPFPTSQTIEYLGHTGKVRSISVSPCGQWLCSGSDDGTVRVWEVDTGRCFKRWDLKKEIERMKQSDSEDSDDDDEERNMDNIVYCVAWNPNPRIPLIAAAVGTCVVMLHTQTGSSKEMDSIEEMILAQIKAPEIYATMTHDGKAALQKMKKVSDWEAEEKVDTISSTDPTADDENDRDDDQDDDDEKDSEGKSSHGFFSDEEEPEWSRMCIDLKKKCSTVVWHHKGDYFATVSSQATHSAVLIHRLSRRQSQSPFKKSKGLVQTVMFHPTKPFFFVASKRNIRIYDLTKQKLMKKLTSPAKWISSMVIHPSGDHVLAGSYDRRLSWYDLDLSNAPYKTLKYHKKAIRGVAFHRSYPLFASAADDGNLHIFHGKVYNDLLTNPLIVPVKILKAHKPVGDLGTLATVFHPTQPWIFSAGADKAIRLFTY